MKKYNQLSEVRLSEIKPSGWLALFLTAQASGMPGNLHRIGYPYTKACWQYRSLTDGGYEAWWPYEQTAYWIDSVIRTAALTDDAELYDRVKDQVEKSFTEDGNPFIGPVELMKNQEKNRWPQAVYFRAIYALWSKTGDDRYLKRIYTHYMADIEFNYSHVRDIVNVETMLKLAELFDCGKLYEKAVQIYHNWNIKETEGNDTDMMGDSVPFLHGVTLNEQAKLAAIIYAFTGDRKHLDACIQLYEKIENYHMLPDGVHSSSEKTCGNESFRTHESCDISDYTWSVGYLLEATGDGKYADWIERACLNALPGAVFPYFTAIQYLSGVNQVICARNSTHTDEWQNTPRMAYQPHHYPECCVGNIGRAMPNYVVRMYQKTEDGAAVSLYGPSVYDSREMKIVQTGKYPFEDTVTMRITLKQPSRNKLRMRIPSWSKSYEMRVNGIKRESDMVNGYILYPVCDQDEIQLQFRKGFRSQSSKDGGVYYTYGPFLLTLKIKERCTIDHMEMRQTKEFPAYNIYPESEWRYAVSGWEVPEITMYDISDNPFWERVPFEIRIRARKLKNWDFVKSTQSENEYKGTEGIDDKQKDCGATEIMEDLVLTPKVPCTDFTGRNLGEEEMITLVPYGCTTIRLTVFPKYLT